VSPLTQNPVALNQRLALFVLGFQIRSDRSVAWRCNPMIVRLDAISGSGTNSEQVLFVTGLFIDGFGD
jgi:hypothetical protein